MSRPNSGKRQSLALICFLAAWLTRALAGTAYGDTSTSPRALLESIGIAQAQAQSRNLQPPTIEAKPDPGAGADAPHSGRAAQAEKPKPDQAAARRKSFDLFTMLMSAVAGLVLFIFGVTQLAQGLAELNTERMRRITGKFTSNRFAGVGTGIVATTLLESSSVTIIMVIAMVSGGVLTFVQSLGVVLGANIGTAVGAQIIALDIEQYVPLLMLTGLLLLFIGKSPTRKRLGVVVLGFGMMFYGLEAIDQAMKPLRTHEPFMHAMRTLGDNPVLGALAGAIFTVIVQSSSATVAIVITMAGSGLMSLPAGVAIMLGAEIGTCADTLLATIGRGRPALRTGVFHLVFNLVTASIGLALTPVLVRFIETISAGASVGRQIANAQMIFNGLGVAAVLPFLPAIARALEKLIPDATPQPDQPPEAQPAQ